MHSSTALMQKARENPTVTGYTMLQISTGKTFRLEFSPNNAPIMADGEPVSRSTALELVNDWNRRAADFKYFL